MIASTVSVQTQAAISLWVSSLAPFRKIVIPDLGEDWRPIKRWYTVMHHFDTEGHHFAAMCTSPVKKPISVYPFSFIDGEYVFGLFVENDPEDPTDQWVILQPNDVMFHEPYTDGEYSS